MEEISKRELDLCEMDKISGGASGKKGGAPRCSKCGKKLKSISDDEYWCENEDCDYYHREVTARRYYEK